ncbi:MAG: hypothetical protein ACXWP5_03025 [Bdellovibrionota bacterium]
MKFAVLASLILISTTVFASGTPVVYCKADKENVQLSFNLSRTDEDLGDVMDKNSESDEFATLGEDDPKSPSVLVGTKAKEYIDDTTQIAALALPKGSGGTLTSLKMGDKKFLYSFMVDATPYKGDLELRIVASNKTDLTKAMTGLMTLITKKVTPDVKQLLSLKAVPVTCVYAWE